MLTLTAEKRGAVGTKNNNRLRKEGKIPGICYGAGNESLSIALNRKDVEKVWKEAGGSTIIELQGDIKGKSVIIHDVKKNPLTGNIDHIDLLIIDKDKKIIVEVPLVFTGVAPAVKELGGSLVQVHHSLKIEATPDKLIHELSADLGKLKDFSSHITVSEISVPEGVEIKESGDTIVASVVEPKEEVEETPTEVDMESVEVESKGKKEEPTDESTTEATKK